LKTSNNPKEWILAHESISIILARGWRRIRLFQSGGIVAWLDFWRNFAFMEYGGKCPLLYMATLCNLDYREIIVFNVGMAYANKFMFAAWHGSCL
jgi:hypothetical protein